jgi:hypothetical protein
MTPEQYIEHEVKLRVHDTEFKRVHSDIKGIKTLLVSILGVGVTSIVVPILLHVFKLA